MFEPGGDPIDTGVGLQRSGRLLWLLRWICLRSGKNDHESEQGATGRAHPAGTHKGRSILVKFRIVFTAEHSDRKAAQAHHQASNERSTFGEVRSFSKRTVYRSFIVSRTFTARIN